MTTLYEIAAVYKADMDKLSDLDLPEETVRDTLEAISGDLQDKAKSIGSLVKHLEVISAGIKEAESQMAARRKAIDKRIESIKDYTLDVMVANQIERIETPYFNLSVAKNPPSVEIYDEAQIPDHFMRHPEPPPPAPDKKSILESLKYGEDVPGCRIKQGLRLSIK